MPKEVRIISYRSWSSANEPVPCLALQGLFLKSHGFEVGAKCRVAYAPGRITIEAYEPSKPKQVAAEQPGQEVGRSS